MTQNTPSEAWQAFRRVFWSLAALMAALLLFLALMGFGPGGRMCKAVAGSAVETKTADARSSTSASANTGSCWLSLSIMLRLTA